MVQAEDVVRLARTLPRSGQHLIRDQIKFRVGKIVYVAISAAAEPTKFHLPVESDLRFHWVRGWLSAIDEVEMRELVVDAWRMVVPKKVSAAYPGP